MIGVFILVQRGLNLEPEPYQLGPWGVAPDARILAQFGGYIYCEFGLVRLRL